MQMRSSDENSVRPSLRQCVRTRLRWSMSRIFDNTFSSKALAPEWEINRIDTELLGVQFSASVNFGTWEHVND